MFDDMSVGGCVIFSISLIGIIALANWIMMLAWNWLMPELFGLPNITYLQMIVLLFITNGLTGGSVVANRSSN